MSNSKHECPLHILPTHFEEWVTDSGVSAQITSLNVRSLSIPEEIDELLNRNTNESLAALGTRTRLVRNRSYPRDRKSDLRRRTIQA